MLRAKKYNIIKFINSFLTILILIIMIGTDVYSQENKKYKVCKLQGLTPNLHYSRRRYNMKDCGNRAKATGIISASARRKKNRKYYFIWVILLKLFTKLPNASVKIMVW